MGHGIAHKSDRENLREMLDPAPLPPPLRVWSADEMKNVRRGFVPAVMEEKWFAYMEGDRLFLHRSWTGHEVYRVDFEVQDGGARILSAWVTGDREIYRRGSDLEERTALTGLIVSLLAGSSDRA